MAPGSALCGWAVDLDPLTTESAWSKLWARIGVLAFVTVLLGARSQRPTLLRQYGERSAAANTDQPR